MQTQADLLQVPVEVASSPHATAAGVAALARLGARRRRGRSAMSSRRAAPAARYEPAIGAAEAEERLGRFERAVARLVDGGPERRDR